MKLTYMKFEDGFLGADQPFTHADSKAVIIPFGLESSVSYESGTSHGPEAIINASHQVELFDEELWCEPYKEIGISTVNECVISKDIKEELKRLEARVEEALVQGKFPLTLGGEHSITPGAIRPFVNRYKKLKILHFDAHADLRDGYNGEHFSHASALRRCLDYDNVEVVSIGIRNISESEVPFYEKNRDRIKIYWGKDRNSWNFDEIANHFCDQDFYLTFDVDGFDGSVMPATGTPEPGGFFWPDAVSIIRKAVKNGNMVGADVNELSPIAGFHSCDFLAAKLCYKILGYKFFKHKL